MSTSFTCCRASGSACIRSHSPARPARRSIAPCPWPATWSSWKALAKQVEQSGIVFMPEFARRCYPATLRLKELLATQLGPPRLVLGHSRLYGFDRYAVPGPTTQITPAPLLIDPGSYLLDWCCFVFQSLPRCPAGSRCQVLSAAEQPNKTQTSKALWRPSRGCDGSDLVRPLSPRALGRRQPLSASAGVPGFRRARGSLAGDARENPSGRARPASRRNGFRSSRQSAMCSTTSSTGWYAAIIRSHPTIREALDIARLADSLRRPHRENQRSDQPAD